MLSGISVSVLWTLTVFPFYIVCNLNICSQIHISVRMPELATGAPADVLLGIQICISPWETVVDVSSVAPRLIIHSFSTF